VYFSAYIQFKYTICVCENDLVAHIERSEVSSHIVSAFYGLRVCVKIYCEASGRLVQNHYRGNPYTAGAIDCNGSNQTKKKKRNRLSWCDHCSCIRVYVSLYNFVNYRVCTSKVLIKCNVCACAWAIHSQVYHNHGLIKIANAIVYRFKLVFDTQNKLNNCIKYMDSFI